MLNDLSFLEVGKTWIPENEKERIALYELNNALYKNDHYAILEPLLQTVYPEQEINEDVKRVFVNLYRSVSKLWADLLFSENPTISKTTTDSTEKYLNDLIKNVDLWEVAKKVAIDVSRYGNGLFKIRAVDGKAVIEAVSPRIWFPVVSPDNINEVIYHVIAYSFVENKVQYLKVEIHHIGKIEHKLFVIDKDTNKIKQEVPLTTIQRYSSLQLTEDTNANEFLIIPVGNSADSESAFGEDDYTDINPLISQIELHLSKFGKDLEEQGNMKYGPADAVDENGKIAKGSYIPMLSGANKQDPPGVVTWTVQADAIKEYISQLMFFFYMLGEISPAMFDPNQTISSNMSGVALKRIMQRMMAKAGRLAESFDKSIKKAFSVAAQLEGFALTDYEINWQDGILDDVSERVSAAQQAGIPQSMSLKTAVAYVQQIEGKTLDDEVAAIETEQKNKTVLPLSDLYPDEDRPEDDEQDIDEQEEKQE